MSNLIDLERGGLLEAAFACSLQMVVPDLLYETELAQETLPYLNTLGLGIVELSEAELAFAQQISSERQGLSLDCFALVAIEAEARSLKRGLWIDAAPVPPRDWRNL